MIEKWTHIASALRRQTVVEFAVDVLSASYRHFFNEHGEEAAQMITTAIGLLRESQEKGDDVDGLMKATQYINHHLFRKNDAAFWFNRIHKKYKMETRSEVDFRYIRRHIVGKRVLDFGSNGGYFALELEKNGFDVLTTDVMDFRDPKANRLPFKQMASPTDIPYGADSADTAIVKTVFHHINENDLHIILNQLRNITTRLIVKEDLYGVTPHTPGLQELIVRQPELRRFTELFKEDQYYFLVLNDYIGNALAHGLTDMSFFFDFHTVGEWEKLLVDNGFTVRHVQYYGFEKTKLHNSLQAWIICDRQE